MTMSENEIVRDFRAAKKKREQIGILAELNQCSREQIREILLRNGINEAELPKKPGRSRTTEPEVFQQQIKKNHAKAEEFRSGKAEPEPEPEEMIPMLLEPEEEKPKGTPIPELVKQACRDKIWSIVQEIAELEREKRELQKFLGEVVEV